MKSTQPINKTLNYDDLNKTKPVSSFILWQIAKIKKK